MRKLLNLNECHNQGFFYVEAARRYTGARNNTLIELVDGFYPPEYIGRSYYYSNKSGDVIDHPNAYAKKGFSSMVYNHSTLRVRVGRLWCGKNSEKYNIVS